MVLVGSRTYRPMQSSRRQPVGGYVRIPLPILGLAFIVAFLISLSSLDPLLTFACIIVLPFLAMLSWREGEPPVAFAALTAQWLQISVGTLRATANGVDLNGLFLTAGANYANWLSLAGLLVLAIGIRMASWGRRPMEIRALHSELNSFQYSRVLVAYCLAQLITFLCQGIIWVIPGLTQAILAAINLRWLFYFLLTVTTLVQKRGYGYLAAATAFEVVTGLASFFSDFKTVFFVLSVSYLMVQSRINLKMFFSLCVLLCGLLYLAIIWSAVKMDYRAYQNGGTGAQVSYVGTWDKLDYLTTLVEKIDEKRFWNGFDLLTQRIEYTRFFGYVTENVPTFIPYDDGGIWGGALYHVITPRLLFPDKASLTADIDNTKRYTGLTFAGGGSDTEIPLGYMAESYIDFGPIGMFVPIGLLGLLIGLEYRYFATRRSYLVFSYGLLPVVFGTVITYEETAIKILGGNLIVCIVSYLALRFVVPAIQPWLIGNRPKRA
ncbi:MAG TPA: hypothetical protein VH206_19615 [Xanthobacteraceae bacterium]|jgi:hypothetical protein|nr:hypothetical protein [Xanthobacteraceae bacterium]